MKDLANIMTWKEVKALVEAAVLAERERIAAHFDAMPGREMFGGTIADEIRGMK